MRVAKIIRSWMLHRPGRSGRAALMGAAVALGSLALIFLPGVIESRTAASGPAGGAKFSGSAPETLQSKIEELSVPPTAQPKSFKPIVITQDEANTYLKNQGPSFLPPAVENPELQIHADSLSAVADVDFDKLQQLGKQNNDVGAQVLGTLFKGRQKVAASGKLQTADGHGQLSIQDLSIGSTHIPDWLTQALLQNYLAKTYKLDLSQPFPLPDHVTRIELVQGQATFIRSPNQKPALQKPPSH